jgi:glycosyltransferase EpsE
MNTDKKISIIMGIYNCANTLDEAIESIIAQTYPNWQMIMCDDGSSDNTYEVAAKYVESDPERFVLIKNETNQGLNITLNNCLALADGDYVARMDGDDISLPDRFEKEVEILNTHPEFAIVSTPMIMFDETGDWGRTGEPIPEPTIIDFAYHTPFHCHAPCMIRREAYLDVEGYTVDKRLLRYEDCNLWFKLYGKGYRGYNLSEPLYKMRDDKNAVARRDIKSRLRAVYVLYTGFKLVNMPKKYYKNLVKAFFRSVIIAFMPKSLYMYFHKKKQNAK